MSQIFTTIAPTCKLKDLVLAPQTMAAIEELLEDLAFRKELLEAGLSPRRKLLLYGPPGCGKTSLAHAIADLCKVNICLVSLGQTVGSLMGQTEKAIESIFEFAANNKVIILIDEFDSIASSRTEDEVNRSGNRAVNSILTSMDRIQPLGIIVGCTNMFNMLDAAVVRRFDMCLEIPRVDDAALKKIAEKILKGRFGLSADDVLSMASTPAGVVQVAQNMLRRKVIEMARQQQQELPGMEKPVGPPVEIQRLREKMEKKG